jgi:hypothetical protein
MPADEVNRQRIAVAVAAASNPARSIDTSGLR